jgi:hypothetical protein
MPQATCESRPRPRLPCVTCRSLCPTFIVISCLKVLPPSFNHGTSHTRCPDFTRMLLNSPRPRLFRRPATWRACCGCPRTRRCTRTPGLRRTFKGGAPLAACVRRLPHTGRLQPIPRNDFDLTSSSSDTVPPRVRVDPTRRVLRL